MKKQKKILSKSKQVKGDARANQSRSYFDSIGHSRIKFSKYIVITLSKEEKLFSSP